jgi:hypothetical protein
VHETGRDRVHEHARERFHERRLEAPARILREDGRRQSGDERELEANSPEPAIHAAQNSASFEAPEQTRATARSPRDVSRSSGTLALRAAPIPRTPRETHRRIARLVGSAMSFTHTWVHPRCSRRARERKQRVGGREETAELAVVRGDRRIDPSCRSLLRDDVHGLLDVWMSVIASSTTTLIGPGSSRSGTRTCAWRSTCEKRIEARLSREATKPCASRRHLDTAESVHRIERKNERISDTEVRCVSSVYARIHVDPSLRAREARALPRAARSDLPLFRAATLSRALARHHLSDKHITRS